MIKVNVIVQYGAWKKKIKSPQAYLNKKINIISKELKFFKKIKIEFTLLLSNGKNIRELNRKYRKKNKTTDVLSFPFYNKTELNKKLNTRTAFYLGDVIINSSKVQNNLSKLPFKNNFDKLWIHGFLHLLGFQHSKDKDFVKMSKFEEKFFKLIN